MIFEQFDCRDFGFLMVYLPVLDYRVKFGIIAFVLALFQHPAE